jgi:hypothetical protein
VLSLVLEREPLQLAASALQGQDAVLRGTALEYLENVLPYEVRRALLVFTGAAPASAPVTTRSRNEVLAELRRFGRRSFRPRG